MPALVSFLLRVGRSISGWINIKSFRSKRRETFSHLAPVFGDLKPGAAIGTSLISRINQRPSATIGTTL